MDRIREVTDDLAGGVLAKPLGGDRGLWIAQDIAWRLTVTIAECEGDVVDALEELVTHLAMAPTIQSVADIIDAYHALGEDWVLPSPDDLFAVGYALPGGYGYATEQVAQGIATVCRETAGLLGDTFEALVDEFVRAEPPMRQPVARRFATYLEQVMPGTASDLARYEAAVSHPGNADPEVDSLGTAAPGDQNQVRLSKGVELLNLEADLTAYLGGDKEGGRHLVIRKTSGGEVVIAEVSPETAAVLQVLRDEGPASIETLGISVPELGSLRQLGVIKPVSWLTLHPTGLR